LFYVDQFDFPGRWLPGYENKTNKTTTTTTNKAALIVLLKVKQFLEDCLV